MRVSISFILLKPILYQTDPISLLNERSLMIYDSCKVNSMLHYFIEAKNKAEAQRASRLLWGEGIDFKTYEVSQDFVRTMLLPSDIVTILNSGKLNIPKSYYPLNSREKSVMA